VRTRVPQRGNVEHANQEHIEYVAVQDRNVIANINTPEDYQALVH